MSIRARVVSRPGSGRRPMLQSLVITAQACACISLCWFPLLSLLLGTSRHLFPFPSKPKPCMCSSAPEAEVKVRRC